MANVEPERLDPAQYLPLMRDAAMKAARLARRKFGIHVVGPELWGWTYPALAAACARFAASRSTELEPYALTVCRTAGLKGALVVAGHRTRGPSREVYRDADRWPAQEGRRVRVPKFTACDLVVPAEAHDAVEVALGLLAPTYAGILRLRFLFDLTLEEVGDLVGRTRERVRQIEEKCLDFLRRRAELDERHPLRLRFGERTPRPPKPRKRRARRTRRRDERAGKNSKSMRIGASRSPVRYVSLRALRRRRVSAPPPSVAVPGASTTKSVERLA